ncbi:sugar ABC transporter ATP-binding protein [Candidatus Bipolaricaulota bacterium]|nr:sugar ABC transporter ATP-binding protein [Candidatus Bipolaricaulota bacterium]
MSHRSKLEMRGISKSFGHVQALDKVDLTLEEGEVLGLIGDNGAGKSTLVKILSGVYQADEGKIYLNGEQIKIDEPNDAFAHGIRMVYQDLLLCGHIDVAGNIFLGRELSENNIGGFLKTLDQSEMVQKSKEFLQELGINLPSYKTQVRNLSGGQKQAVAISRVLWGDPDIVIMDEPVANLGVERKKEVLELILKLKDRSIGTIVIDHSFENIFTVADRVLVLREGERVGVRLIEETDPDELTKLMVGAEIADAVSNAVKSREANKGE